MVQYSVLKGLYVTEKTIGCGGFAKVKLATHIATGEKVAIKIMNKNLLGDDLHRIQLEMKALKSLCHEHICKLYQIIENETHFFIVMEYCSGGELFDHIVEKNRLSECESRIFFRQIVSAVAYLHSLGYAHRDLKPENVLLDKDQNLKLIDFGLCARPDGGMLSPLFTSCGSPTYAAPELILGKQYLGQEVDVWAMGVLLYALLAGALPFDDLNIDGLYKKILSGKYEEPPFISQESKNLIKSMLQVDPKKRITVEQLLTHPWLSLGVLEPIRRDSENFKNYDACCVAVMARQYRLDPEDMWRHLRKWKYDYHTATYFLLLNKKKKKFPLKLNSVPINFQFKIKKNLDNGRSRVDSGRGDGNKKMKINFLANEKKPLTEINAANTLASPNFRGASEFLEPHKPSSGGKRTQKRVRSPTLDDDNSLIPAKKSTPSGKTTPKTPDRSRTPSTPGSTRRVLGSIERSLHKVRYVLTPRKPVADSVVQPVFLTTKNLCNVSTTQSSDPEHVITELAKALQNKGIECNRKGFTLRGKMEPNLHRRLGGCSFELEICYLPFMGHILKISENVSTPTKSILKNANNYLTPSTTERAASTPNSGKTLKFGGENAAFVGIRRKRLKGDSWCYKKVCEEVLNLAATEFKQVTESSV